MDTVIGDTLSRRMTRSGHQAKILHPFFFDFYSFHHPFQFHRNFFPCFSTFIFATAIGARTFFLQESLQGSRWSHFRSHCSLEAASVEMAGNFIRHSRIADLIGSDIFLPAAPALEEDKGGTLPCRPFPSCGADPLNTGSHRYLHRVSCRRQSPDSSKPY